MYSFFSLTVPATAKEFGGNLERPIFGYTCERRECWVDIWPHRMAAMPTFELTIPPFLAVMCHLAHGGRQAPRLDCQVPQKMHLGLKEMLGL